MNNLLILCQSRSLFRGSLINIKFIVVVAAPEISESRKRAPHLFSTRLRIWIKAGWTAQVLTLQACAHRI